MWYRLLVNKGTFTVKNQCYIFAAQKIMILHVIKGGVRTYLYPTPKTKITIDLTM